MSHIICDIYVKKSVEFKDSAPGSKNDGTINIVETRSHKFCQKFMRPWPNVTKSQAIKTHLRHWQWR